jgi:magnesium transporter
MSDGEKEFLFGVIDFYQSRISTKMTIASERLALLAVLTLPVTALASIYGMNFEHMPELKLWFWYPLVILTMLVISGLLLRWARRKGWW